MKKVYQNIPENSFKNHESETKVYRAIVVTATKGIFSLSLFACIQFLMGAQSKFLKLTRVDQGKELMELISRLAIYSIDLQATADSESSVQLMLTRNEVELFRILLNARMAHCENERDIRADTFNADTYIGQKLLLLDIREWLMCVSMELHDEVMESNTAISAN